MRFSRALVAVGVLTVGWTAHGAETPPVNEIEKLIWLYSPTADSNLNFSKIDATALFDAARAKGLTVQFLNADKILPGKPFDERKAALASTLKQLTEAHNSFVLIRTHGNTDGIPKNAKTDTKLAFFTYEGKDIRYSEFAAVLDPQFKVKGIAVDSCHADNAHLNESGKAVPGRVSCASSVNETGQGPESSQFILDTLTGLVRQAAPVPLGKTATEIYAKVLEGYNPRLHTANKPLTSYGEDRLALFKGKSPGRAALQDKDGRPVSLCVSPFGKKLFVPGMSYSAHELDPKVNGYDDYSKSATLRAFGISSESVVYFHCQENGEWRVDLGAGPRAPVNTISWKNCPAVIENLKKYNRTASSKVSFNEVQIRKECAKLGKAQAWLEGLGWRLPPGYAKALRVGALPGSCVDDMGQMMTSSGFVQTKLCCPDASTGGSGRWNVTRKRCEYACTDISGKAVANGSCFTPRPVAGRELAPEVKNSYRCQSGTWPWSPDKACCEKSGGVFELQMGEWKYCVAPLPTKATSSDVESHVVDSIN